MKKLKRQNRIKHKIKRNVIFSSVGKMTNLTGSIFNNVEQKGLTTESLNPKIKRQ